jgi:hypothetical protein
MDKGIRPACNAKFMQMLPQRAELGNKRFRAEVRHYIIQEFACTPEAASTHYNHAFKECKKSNPELVEGLGRPEGKNNGGRKKKAVVVAEAVTLLLGYTAPAVDPNDAGETAPEQTTFTVKKKSDDTVIAVDISFEAAQALVAKAAAAKKAKLYFV